MELFEALGLFVTTLGGVSVLFLGLSSYIGRIWASRYSEAMKAKYQKEIETFKKDLDLIKESSSRYSGKQFELYSSLYYSLIDLKEKGDLLWDDAERTQLKNFSFQLNKTKKEVEKSYLFLEEQHYKKFDEIFKKFYEFQIGKKRLVMMNAEEFNTLKMDELYDLIDYNRIRKDEYDLLIKEIRDDLKKQIRGTG